MVQTAVMGTIWEQNVMKGASAVISPVLLLMVKIHSPKPASKLMKIQALGTVSRKVRKADAM